MLLKGFIENFTGNNASFCCLLCWFRIATSSELCDHFRFVYTMIIQLCTFFKMLQSFLEFVSHREDSNISAKWPLSATSHVKRTCDGLVGMVK